MKPSNRLYVRAVYTTWFCQDDFVIHYKSCNVNPPITQSCMILESCTTSHVLFAMTKSCHFSQSTYRSLRLMSFQEKQEQGYTCSIHNSLLKGHGVLRCPCIWFLEFYKLSCSLFTFLGELSLCFLNVQPLLFFQCRTILFVKAAWYNYITANVIFGQCCSLNATDAH